MLGSLVAGAPGVDVGTGSVVTAAGVCAPFPGLFLTDGASFSSGGEGVLTAAQAPPCSGPSCSTGSVIFDETFAPVVPISTDSISTPPTYGVYEIPLGNLPCTSMQLTIVADCQLTGGNATIRAYLNASGMDLATRAFIFGTAIPQFANIPVIVDAAYHSYTWVGYPSRSPAFADFSGPLTSQSLYLWPGPPSFPDFLTADWNIKNVHVKVVAL